MVCQFCVLFAQESRMNKLLTGIVLVCFSIGTIAQEKQIWACQQQAVALLKWENGSWERYGVVPIPLLVTIDGANSSYKEGEYEYALSCSKIEYYAEVSCFDETYSEHLYFNLDNGKLGRSNLLGATDTDDRRDTVSAQIYNCTKF